MQFIVNSLSEEKEDFLKNVDTAFNNDSELILTIMPTTACNFRCPYCYEKGIAHSVMRKDVIELLKNKILKLLIGQPSIENVRINIFGGEPTIAWAVVEQIIQELSSIFKEIGIQYALEVTTNGYLLDGSKIKSLKSHNLKNCSLL